MNSSGQPEEKIARRRRDGDIAIAGVRGHRITARHPVATRKVVVLLQGAVIRGGPPDDDVPARMGDA